MSASIVRPELHFGAALRGDPIARSVAAAFETEVDIPSAVPLIILPGALGAAEGGSALDGLRAGRTLLSFDYSGDDDLPRLTNRVLDAATATGAAKFDLLGQSYGGWIAQCITRRHPDRIGRLVLSHSFTLDRDHAWRFQLARKMLRILPLPMSRRLLLSRLGKALSPIRDSDPDLHAQQLATIVSQTRTRAFWNILVSQQTCLWQSLQPDWADLPEISSDVPVLIIESDNDPIVDETERAALRASLPHATIKCFLGTGHVSARIETAAFIETVENFLVGQRPD